MSVLQFDSKPEITFRHLRRSPSRKQPGGWLPRASRSLLPLSIAVLLAACSSVPLDETAEAPAPDIDILQQPLRVPALEAMRDSAPRKLEGGFVPVGWGALPSWNDDDFSQLWPVLINNCKGLVRPTGGSMVQQARATPRAWQPVCAAAAQAQPQGSAQVRAFIEQHLQPWRLLDDQGKHARNTVTGYYEPLIHGARKRGGDYQWPLYQPPHDLLTIDLGSVYPDLAGKRVRGKLDGKRVVPYDTRAEIAASPDRQPPAIVWANDPVEAFFLQIQGSGRVRLPDGQMIRLAYADHNGQPYASIGRWLADQGELPLAQTSMQNIKAWARRNPQRVQEMLNVNQAMVFFREESVAGAESGADFGPKGAYGIPLASQRAIAVDTRYVPLGAPVYLATTMPSSSQPLRRLVFAQDTGAAIKGAARADFYWGFGDEAGALAGRMKQNGEMWVLWPKQAGAPSAR
ncbi:MAG: murein transglycosylase A [Alcaligenaceae bacterium]|nr:murein transglycosylase A [Alcaligenaceae bacterium]